MSVDVLNTQNLCQHQQSIPSISMISSYIVYKIQQKDIDFMAEQAKATKGKALVTGATGFIGSCLTKALLERGYTVRASVRNKADTAKLEPLTSLPYQDKLEFVEADLLNPSSWDPAVSGCDYVFHAAAPVLVGPTVDESLVVKPMLEGTMAVMKACAAHPEVKAVVMTSSAAAVYSVGQPCDRVYTEEDWADLSCCSPYGKGKTLSEKAALDFYDTLDKAKRFKFSVINPVYVFGPTIMKGGSAPGEVLKNLMTGETKKIPKQCMAIVDVRDVAAMHIAALENPNSDRQRYISYCGEDLWIEEIAEILRSEFGKYGYKIPDKVMAECPVEEKDTLAGVLWGKKFATSNEKAKKELGMKFIGAKEAILEMAHSFIKTGVVPDLISKKQRVQTTLHILLL
eukprot:TRINITY_DN2392_c0_g1_i1.p1 TRINITY_DN2392_c0_g1~~TRINITY_DN2392_c0_g1_i1.p1  ORF type:complete len:399 (-),score=38.69 TRINITY_DN2392_c0_g1_i1:55-1251(-)